MSRMRGAEPVAQVAQHVEDAGLHGDVQRRGRLVGDQHLRAGRPPPSRSSPAGACRRRAGAGSCSTRCSAAGCRPARAARSPRSVAACRAGPGGLQHLADLPAHGEDRVQRGHRLLEDVGDVLAADVPQRRASGSRSARCRRAGPSRRRGRCAAAARSGAIAVTLLPQPDSPTSAEHLARRDARRTTSSTARPVPSSVRNATVRSRTSSSGDRGGGVGQRRGRRVTAARLRVEGVAQAVAEQVERQRHHHDRESREDRQPRRRRRNSCWALASMMPEAGARAAGCRGPRKDSTASPMIAAGSATVACTMIRVFRRWAGCGGQHDQVAGTVGDRRGDEVEAAAAAASPLRVTRMTPGTLRDADARSRRWPATGRGSRPGRPRGPGTGTPAAGRSNREITAVERAG